jgi:sterol 3beta-glucosyltransferase
MVLPIKDVETARKEKTYHWLNFGLVIVIRGHEELFFEFSQETARDECLKLLTDGVDSVEKEPLHPDRHSDNILGIPPDQVWFQTTRTLDDDRYSGLQGDLSNLAERSDEDTPAIMFDSNAVSMVSFKPLESLRFTCLTIGSRGDVQPYIALCKVFFPPIQSDIRVFKETVIKSKLPLMQNTVNGSKVTVSNSPPSKVIPPNSCEFASNTECSQSPSLK